MEDVSVRGVLPVTVGNRREVPRLVSRNFTIDVERTDEENFGTDEDGVL